jgi:hypothetical protein
LTNVAWSKAVVSQSLEHAFRHLSWLVDGRRRRSCCPAGLGGVPAFVRSGAVPGIRGALELKFRNTPEDMTMTCLVCEGIIEECASCKRCACSTPICRGCLKVEPSFAHHADMIVLPVIDETSTIADW